MQKCLDLWSSGSDSIRIAAFLSIRKLASSSDESILDSILKVGPRIQIRLLVFFQRLVFLQSAYLTLIRSSKSTSAYTLPSINLMKNSASEVFCIDHSSAYQQAFGYIRQLAIHLRNSMKIKSKVNIRCIFEFVLQWLTGPPFFLGGVQKCL